MNSSNLATTGHWIESLRSGLAAHGWREGANLTLDLRFTDGDAARNRPLLEELLALKPDVLVLGTDSLAKSALALTQSVPIVFAIGNDPVGLGVVKSLARPGGTVTGQSLLVFELTLKRLSLLRETLPRLSRLGVIYNPANPLTTKGLAALSEAVRGIGISMTAVAIGKREDVERAFEQLAKSRAEAVLQIPDPVYTGVRERLAALAVQNKMATMFQTQEFVDAGALMSYAADFPAAYRRSATYVDKILKGAKPADLPVEQANVYEFVINLKTARALGITLPQTVRLQATRVVE